MAYKSLYIVALFGLLASVSLRAQDTIPRGWNTGKIRGSRYIPYFSCNGNPFLTDKFMKGEIEFEDGIKIDNLNLRYSGYKDEVIYLNTRLSAQIIIDRQSLKAFSLIDTGGRVRTFRLQYYSGFLPGKRFFEVLSEGEIALLAYRKVELQTCPVYTDNSGTIKNLEYQKNFTYYLYNDKKGYEQIRIGKNSLYSKFDKPNLKLVKKLLRSNKIAISDETGFLKAWNLIQSNRIPINF